MTLWEKARLDPPAKKLELFSYENNPVRLVLCFLNFQTSFFLNTLTFSCKRSGGQKPTIVQINNCMKDAIKQLLCQLQVINLASGMMYRGRRVRTGLETLYQRVMILGFD